MKLSKKQSTVKRFRHSAGRERMVKRPNIRDDKYSFYERAKGDTEQVRELQGHVKASNQVPLVQIIKITKHCVRKKTFCQSRKRHLKLNFHSKVLFSEETKKVSTQQSNHVSLVQTSLHIAFTPSNITSSHIAKK